MCRWHRIAVAAIVLVASSSVWSQAYPSRPIRLVVPFVPGGTIDAYARALARQVEGQIGQSIVIDNRGGANGILGADIVAKAAPDGYTLLNNAASFVINPAMYKKMPYDTEKDYYDVPWHAWFAPAKTPAVIVERLHAEIAKAVQQPKLREYFRAGGFEPQADSPAEFRKIFLADIKRYAEIVRAAKIEPE